MATNKTAEQLMKQGLVDLMFNDQLAFWSVLAYRLETVADESCDGGWTDGVRFGYKPDFVKSLHPSQVVTFWAHEAGHSALGHPWRREWRDHRLWNIACDYAINLALLDSELTALPDWLCEERFRDMSAEQIYDVLLKEQGPNGNQQQSSGFGASQGKQGAGKGKCPPEMMGEVRDPASADHIPSLKADWEVAVIQAATAAQAMGHCPAFAKRLVEQIREPKVDWKSILRRFVQECAKADYSWRTPNRRYIPLGLYLPSLRSEDMPPMVIAVDTSGSISQQILDDFAGEMQSIIDECQPERVHVIYCDADVQRVDVFERGESLEMNPAGGGGTDFRPVFAQVAADGVGPACLVYLTDTYGSFPQNAPDYPVLWASTDGTNVPFGELIPIKDRLY